MKKTFKREKLTNKRILFAYLPILAVFIAILPVLESQPKAEAGIFYSLDYTGIAILNGNSFFPIEIEPEFKVAKKIRMVITGYSSTPHETDNDPEITASGTRTRDGIVANNLLTFGTKIRIPEIYGDKIFVVEDRMNRDKGYYHTDIWFPSYLQALSFGSKITYIEVLEKQI